MRFAYADPPYPGFAHLYEDHSDFGGEVDHGDLIDRLMAEFSDGWALSTSSKTLAYVLALCEERCGSGPMRFQSAVRVGAWTKPMPPNRSRFPLRAWEPVVFFAGRPQLSVGMVDWVYSSPPRDFPGQLVGIKPSAFSAWVFRSLGAEPRDSMADLFPGSGAVGKAWEVYSSRDAAATRLAVGAADASHAAERDASCGDGGAVAQDLRDASFSDPRAVAHGGRATRRVVGS